MRLVVISVTWLNEDEANQFQLCLEGEDESVYEEKGAKDVWRWEDAEHRSN